VDLHFCGIVRAIEIAGSVESVCNSDSVPFASFQANATTVEFNSLMTYANLPFGWKAK